MKKLLRNFLIIIAILLLLSPICYGAVDLKEQIKKEDGSLFEKIIAECIGGIAQTVFDFTTRKRVKCRFQGL